MMEEAVVYEAPKHEHLLPSFVDIHIACVENDYTMATFLPPFDRDEMLAYWQNYAKVHTVVMQLVEGELAGYVVLKDCGTATGPFRAEVLKLLVSPQQRNKGIARRVMQKLEEVAQAKGLTMLLLDTTIGTPAEHVYPRLGYTMMGMIPRYGISPKDGKLLDEVWFYKQLPGHGEAR